MEDVADEPWVENATARDLRERLVRVVPMRAGHIAVRYTTGPSTVLGVQARRRRGSIEVRAEERGTPDLVATDWKERWTYPDQLVDADAVFMVLEEALWRLSPPGIGGAVSLRLEQHDEVEAYRNSYAFVWGWLIALFVIVLGTMALGAQSSDGFLGVIARLGGTRVEGFVPFLLVAAVALTAILPAASGAWCVERIADRLDLPYAGREPLEVVGSFLGCAGFVVAVILSGRSWGLVAALPWVVGIAWVVGVLWRAASLAGFGPLAERSPAAATGHGPGRPAAPSVRQASPRTPGARRSSDESGAPGAEPGAVVSLSPPWRTSRTSPNCVQNRVQAP